MKEKFCSAGCSLGEPSVQKMWKVEFKVQKNYIIIDKTNLPNENMLYTHPWVGKSPQISNLQQTFEVLQINDDECKMKFLIPQ